MSSHFYFPILKSTDAELRGYGELQDEVKKRILPTIELTKSRRSKTNDNADVWKRIESLKDCIGHRRFILDLTTEESLQNVQIEEMLGNARNGYESWVNFVKRVADSDLRVIPVVHYNASEQRQVRLQIEALSGISDVLAFRADADDDIETYVQNIGHSFDTRKLILILDGGYFNPDGGTSKADSFPAALDAVSKIPLKGVTCAASSFPSSVAAHGPERGSFPIAEIDLISSLQEKYEDLYYGDFGSVHPVRYEGRWGGWVPRVDFPIGRRFFYHRCRRENGGYARAAHYVVNDPNYSPVSEFEVWGDQEIAAAADGNPTRKSPAHWISVRINLFLTRQYLRLKGSSRMSL